VSLSERAPIRGSERSTLQTLGLARRAGRAAVGTRAVLTAARSRRLEALVVAHDASPNALDRVHGAGRGVPIVRCGTRETLGLSVGRGPVAVVGVTDRDFARRIAAGVLAAYSPEVEADSARRGR
jgi:ribosomal protein L7Ae-like RNA K-turn-binding protein